MRRRKCHYKINISVDLIQTVFLWDTCYRGHCGGKPDIQLDGFVMKIRRLGMEEFCVEYDPWDCDDQGLRFLWDDALYDLPHGRYEGVLFYEGDECMFVELEKKKQLTVTPSRMKHKRESECHEC